MFCMFIYLFHGIGKRSNDPRHTTGHRRVARRVDMVMCSWSIPQFIHIVDIVININSIVSLTASDFSMRTISYLLY